MKYKNKILYSILVPFAIGFSYISSQGSVLLLDDFEGYADGEFIAEATDPNFAVSPWSRAGAIHASNPRVQDGEGVGESKGLRVRGAWDNGDFGFVRYHFEDDGSQGVQDFSAYASGLQLQFDARITNISLDPSTTLDVVVGMNDGNGGTEYTSPTVSFANEGFETYLFSISETQMTRTSGSGTFDLSQVEFFRITMRNSGEGFTSDDRQWAYFDNVTVVPEPASVAALMSIFVALVCFSKRFRAK